MAVTLVMAPGDRVALLGDPVAIARRLDDRPILATSVHSLGLGLLWAGRFADALLIPGHFRGPQPASQP